jgi:hypothetical protein
LSLQIDQTPQARAPQTTTCVRGIANQITAEEEKLRESHMKEHADTMGDEPLILSGANTVNISGSKSGGMGGMSALFKKSSTLAS